MFADLCFSAYELNAFMLGAFYFNVYGTGRSVWGCSKGRYLSFLDLYSTSTESDEMLAFLAISVVRNVGYLTEIFSLCLRV